MKELNETPDIPSDKAQLNKYAEDLSRLYILEKERRKELETLALEMSTMQERERGRIADQLHDTIGQSLALARVKIGMILQLDRAPKKDELMGIDELIQKTITSTRNLLFEINPNVLLELGLTDALEWFAEKTHEKHGLIIDISGGAEADILEQSLKILLFTGARELLTNTVKHAQTERAEVIVERSGDNISVKVQDHGIGFNPSERLSRSSNELSYGLFNLRQRLFLKGGSLDIYSSPGNGTSAVITLPAGSGTRRN
ncbi:MAG: sensor histidine kinase [Thermodesulfovibrionales bacterium]|nr:sensor histidine kinase [Thermodesulfovibrionales bacterium]